ncbi:MAG: membrane protein FxsA [Mesorhizobium sp.]|nr:FxsA family protein [Mesorhizobium sp.]MBN9242550.1 membrane protein FxsA [Mesorhizobium sp.]MBN9273859.1 membrane protein FxsA [Mesorhizobium sp.]
MRISFLPLLFLALPLMEIAGFVIVGRQIGALAVVGLVLASAIAGSLLLRHQGFGVMARARAEIEAGRDPSRQLAHGAMIVLAAILLIVPGFLTDIVGLLLFLPPVRDLAWKYLKNRITVVSGFGMRRSRERTIDLDAEEFSRKPDPESPWRRLTDD